MCCIDPSYTEKYCRKILAREKEAMGVLELFFDSRVWSQEKIPNKESKNFKRYVFYKLSFAVKPFSEIHSPLSVEALPIKRCCDEFIKRSHKIVPNE